MPCWQSGGVSFSGHWAEAHESGNVLGHHGDGDAGLGRESRPLQHEVARCAIDLDTRRILYELPERPAGVLMNKPPVLLDRVGVGCGSERSRRRTHPH